MWIGKTFLEDSLAVQYVSEVLNVHLLWPTKSQLGIQPTEKVMHVRRWVCNVFTTTSISETNAHVH